MENAEKALADKCGQREQVIFSYKSSIFVEIYKDMMIKLLSFPLSVLAYLWFLFFICLFHPVQWLCLNLFGYQAHKRSVDVLNFFLVLSLVPVFSCFKSENTDLIPEGKPLIFMANHQSLCDIIGMGWLFRKFHPKYVSKIELGKNIPSVSFNLRHGGSALIDRRDPKQALPALKQMGEYIQKYNRSVIIYPEGTRSKEGKTKAFANNGVKILCKYAPDAYVVPVTINNSWKVFRYGKFPLGLGNRITLTVHAPMPVRGTEFNTLFENAERAVVESVKS
jgi:1-acyl-sn-glycerol-3-phosphate acyltransferase